MNTEIYFVRHAHSVFSLQTEETRKLDIYKRIITPELELIDCVRIWKEAKLEN